MMCLALRAAHANCMKDRELLATISQRGAAEPRSHSLLASIRGRGHSYALAKQLGMDDAAWEGATYTRLSEHLCWTPLFTEQFRYCPSCLEQGYHSIYFQLPSLVACPAHGTELKDACGVCNRRLPECRLFVGWFNRPFCCPWCGGSLANNIPSIRNLFDDRNFLKKQYEEAWRPLGDWCRKLQDTNYAFGFLRDWAIYAGMNSPRESACLTFGALTALRGIGEGHGLKLNAIQFEVVQLAELNNSMRTGPVDSYAAMRAYRRVKTRIETTFICAPLTRLVKGDEENLHSDDMGSATDCAYLWWRASLEGKRMIGLLRGQEIPPCIQIPPRMLPTAWSRISERLWELIFEAIYASALTCITQSRTTGNRLRDLLSVDISRYCLFLPEEYEVGWATRAGVMLFPKIEGRGK